ncbi:AsmA family protein [Methylobrevis albus]|uniref:AsmA family protein n=1 Tax=Methylobrevis albus TaxID=2793297 RepID=A0A931HZ23_9HYPH|nr:AsmA-like C-terminal region-containing protein [Methylobrevis albus]MBH0236712.1 AsmA family protein [Methylobrevis albus]
MLALLTALVGPQFVDWNAFRSSFEEQAEAILGHPVEVAGSADAQLLPVPSLTFTDVRVGGDGDEPLMTVGRFAVRVELFPLMSGEIRVLDMTLDEPVVNARLTEDGDFAWLSTDVGRSVDPKKVVLEKVEIRGGRVVVSDERRGDVYVVSGIDAHVDARSLAGPYKVDGTAMFGDVPARIQAATGEPDAEGRLRVTAEMLPVNRPLSIAVDGIVAGKDGRPTYAGTLALRRVVPAQGAGDGEPPAPMHVSAKFELDPLRLLLKEGEFRYGPEDRPIVVTGAANVTFADEPFFDAVLSSRQVDIDRALGGGAQAPVAAQDAIAALGATLAALPKPPLPGRLGFDSPGFVVGGNVIQEVRFDVETAENGWSIEQFDARLPGRSSFAAAGDIDLSGAAPRFTGTVTLRSEQPSTLIGWWQPDAGSGRIDAFSASAWLDVGASGALLRDIDATAGETRLRGQVRWRPPAAAGEKREIAVDLGADVLNYDAVRAIAGIVAGRDPAATLKESRIALKLGAARLDVGALAVGGVDVDAVLDGGSMQIERLRLADVGGAALSASGRIADLATAPDGDIEARLTGDRLGGVATLLRAVLPDSPAADFFATAAPVLAPVDVSGSIRARARGGATALDMRIDGTAGATRVTADVGFDGRVDDWRAARLNVSAAIEGPNGARMMRQLGFDVADDGSAGAGSARLTFEGEPQDGLDLDLSARLGATAASATGRLALPEAGPSGRLALSFESDDAGPILALAGPRFASLTRSLPANLTATVELDGSRLAATGIDGRVVGTTTAGALTLDRAPARPVVTGELDLGALSLEGLLELSLGSGVLEPPVEAGESWSEIPFGAGLLEGIDGDIALRSAALEIADGLTLDGATLRLRNAASGFALDDIAGGWRGGRAGGSIGIARGADGTVRLKGTGSLAGAALDEIVWRRGGRAVATGALDLSFEAEGSGRTLAGVVSGLGGGGTFRVGDGVLRSFNPAAFSQVIRAADAGLELTDAEIAAAFAARVDAGDLAFQSIDGAFTIAGGTLRAPRISVAARGAATVGAASIDLAAARLTSDWSFAVDPGADAVSGAQAQVGILFDGPLAEPERRIDVTAFTAFLTLRAFEREVARVEEMQADILEREWFSRQLKRISQDAELARLDAEAAARRAEEEAAARAAAEQAAQERAAEEERARREAEAARQRDSAVPADPALDRQQFADEIRRRLGAPRVGDPNLPGVNVPAPPAGIGLAPLPAPTNVGPPPGG